MAHRPHGIWVMVIAVGLGFAHMASAAAPADNGKESTRTLLVLPDDGVPVLAGLTPVSPRAWGETEVRRVLHTFAWGGQASDAQIHRWGRQHPVFAIREMLTFDPVNGKLSAPDPDDPSVQFCDTLQGLQDFWGSDDPSNPMRQANRSWYATLGTIGGDTIAVHPLYVYLAWSRAVHTPGCNPFLHRMAFYLTNYHASIHVENAGPPLMRSYYDDTLRALSQGENFVSLMTMAASHAAVARAYGHMGNYFDQAREFQGNDDFAREYFQLLFGIQGVTEDPVYHEDVTIEHNAWLLTGMNLDAEPYAFGSEFRPDWLVAPIDFSNHFDAAGRQIWNLSAHFGAYQGDNSCLEILNTQICGATADVKLKALGQVAASHPESLDSTPLKLLRFFAGDVLLPEDIVAARTAWADANYDMLRFLQAWAISTRFHESGGFKFRSAFDRNIVTHNLNQLTAEEAYAEPFNRGPLIRMFEQGALVFNPIRDVFGGQTGADAANDRYVFKNAFDANVNDPEFLATTQEYYRLVEDGPILSWTKDWGAVIPVDSQGMHVVSDVAFWLWKRFVGDGGQNFDQIARAQVYALLATGFDFAAVVDPERLDVVYNSNDLKNGVASDYKQALADMTMDFSTEDANQRVGLAINFITALPYGFATGGVQ